MHALIKDLKIKNPDLKEAEIEGILYLIKNTPNLTNNNLISLTGLPKETLKDFKSSFSNYLDASSSDLISLNENGKNLLEEINPGAFKWSLLEYSDSNLENKISEIRKKYNLIPKREYDQFFATSKTSVSKAKILYEKGLIEDKSIALIGDDDLVSVVIGLMGAKYKKLVVFDVDRQILDTVEKIFTDEKIGEIETVLWDVRENLDKKFANQFDVVMTDPPYTKPGIQLFLNRSIEFLRKSGDYSGEYIFLFYGNSFKNPDRSLDIQNVIQQYSLVVEEKINKFSRYDGAESIGSASSLYVLKTTPWTKALDNYTANNIYTFEELKKSRFPFVSQYTFKVFNVPNDILRSKDKLIEAVHEICNSHRLKIAEIVATRFKTQGFTISLILKNSNLTLHTWPEYKSVHLDLVTCRPIYNIKDLLNTVCKVFKTSLVEMRKVE